MSKSETTVRPAAPGDLPGVKAVLRDTFETTWRPHLTPQAARNYIETDRGSRYAETHCGEFWVADVHGEIGGLVHWRGDFIESLHVSSRFQGMGIGKALLALAEREIRKAGFPQARLETDTFNERAMAVYLALGYVEGGRYPDTEWESGFTTVLYEKQLG